MVEAYIYKIENKITGEFYFGYRYKNQKLQILPEDDLWIEYFTSSTRIKNDIDKYGVDAFTASIEYRNIDSIECWKEEQRLIKHAWKNKLLLNGKYHDPESNVEMYRRVNATSQKARENMSKAGKGRPKSESHKKILRWQTLERKVQRKKV